MSESGFSGFRDFQDCGADSELPSYRLHTIIMRFRIQPQHRETVTVVRKSAFESAEETTVAEDVICMIQPVTSGTVQREALELRSGVAVQETDRMVLLSKPDTRIKKGDFLVRASDSSEFRVIDILHVKGSPVMRLYSKSIGVL